MFYELNKLAEIIREISYVSQTLNGVLVTNKKEDATNTHYSMSASQMAHAKVQEATQTETKSAVARGSQEGTDLLER